MPGHPPCNKDELIERLMNENAQNYKVIEELKLMLRMEAEFDGLTLIGGYKALIKAYQEQKEKSLTLSIELEKLKKKL